MRPREAIRFAGSRVDFGARLSRGSPVTDLGRGARCRVHVDDRHLPRTRIAEARLLAVTGRCQSGRPYGGGDVRGERGRRPRVRSTTSTSGIAATVPDNVLVVHTSHPRRPRFLVMRLLSAILLAERCEGCSRWMFLVLLTHARRTDALAKPQRVSVLASSQRGTARSSLPRITQTRGLVRATDERRRGTASTMLDAPPCSARPAHEEGNTAR